MIFVDPRAGSKELLIPLSQFGHKVRSKTMKFGDVAFTIQGPSNSTLRIAIEYKKLDDLLNSLKTKRLVGHQLPGLVNKDCCDIPVLLLEGIYGADHQGHLVELIKRRNRKGRMELRWSEPYGSWQYNVFCKMLHTIRLQAKVDIIELTNFNSVVHWIASLYAWGQKPWEKHHTHLAFDRSIVLRPDRIMFMAPSQTRAFAKEIPGIGWERSLAVANTFPFPVDMFEASKGDWMAIDGIGPLTATRAWETLHLRTKKRSKVLGAEHE